MKKYVIGADIGGTTVKLGFFTVEGELLCKWEIPTDISPEGNILKDLAVSCENKMKECGYEKSDFSGIGVGVPGPVKSDGSVENCVNLGWGEKQIKKEMEEIIGLPAKVGNDANIAALGEAWKGSAAGFKNVVMVTLGTGVGGGIIINGKIISGAHGYAGEIGHLTLNSHETVKCNCGKAGCFEQYCSATGIVNETKKAMKKFGSWTALSRFDNLLAKDIFDEAKRGDTFAKTQVDVFCKRLARGISLICGVVDPEIVVIGGGVSNAGSIITENTARHYDEYSFGSQKKVRFVLASLGNDAGIWGCAALALE